MVEDEWVTVIARSDIFRGLSFLIAVRCGSVTGLYYLYFANQEGFSVRVLFCRRDAGECAVNYAGPSVLRVSYGNCLKVVRQDGSRGNEIIVPAVLYHAHFATCLAFKGRVADCSANSSHCDNARSLCCLFVVCTIGNKRTKDPMGAIGLVVLGLFRGV